MTYMRDIFNFLILIKAAQAVNASPGYSFFRLKIGKQRSNGKC